MAFPHEAPKLINPDIGMTAYYVVTPGPGSIPPPRGPAPSTPEHCVRCHASYRYNVFGDCVVPHVFDVASATIASERYDWIHDQPRADWRYASACCGEGVNVVERAEGKTYRGMLANAFCFRGFHTAHIEEVEPSYNETNFFSCRLDDRGRCTRPVLLQRSLMPLFDFEVARLQQGLLSSEGDSPHRRRTLTGFKIPAIPVR
ncbi:hypothetical protein BC834DRAFT_425294 [Gloeopeniophorella convolvens]|nr:hypothetical protein BC834DRAFT_425294 [Gloeopeniophorella convolvens]